MADLATRIALKAIFETGDALSQASFVDLIDSLAVNSEVPSKLQIYTPMPALIADVTKSINTKTIAANQTFNLSSLTPAVGTRTKLRVTSDPTYPIDILSRRITVPTYYDFAKGQNATIVDIPSGTTVDLDIEYTGTRWEGQASNSLVRYVPNQSTLLIGFNVGGANNNGVNGGNIAIGVNCFSSNVSASDSQFMGYEAGKLVQTGVGNMGYGRLSLTKSVHSGNNTAFGDSTLKECIGDARAVIDGGPATPFGNGNGAFGYICMQNLTVGDENNAFGRGGLFLTTTGSYNNTFGNSAGSSNITGSRNSLFGWQTGLLVTGHDNAAFGYYALGAYTQFSGGNQLGENAAFGYASGGALITGGRNTFVGGAAGASGLQKTDAYISMALGWNTYTTKDYQVVLGSSDVTETLLRGDVVFTSLLASSTPATNGHMTIEKTSNTTLTFKLKGSDGIVRFVTLTLAP